MEVTGLQIVIGALGTVTKRLVKGLEDLEIRGQLDNIGKNTAKSWRLEETSCLSNFSERP